MIHVTQTCSCGRTLRPDPTPDAERYPIAMVHPDGREECPTRPGPQGLPERLPGG